MHELTIMYGVSVKVESLIINKEISPIHKQGNTYFFMSFKYNTMTHKSFVYIQFH